MIEPLSCNRSLVSGVCDPILKLYFGIPGQMKPDRDFMAGPVYLRMAGPNFACGQYFLSGRGQPRQLGIDWQLVL